MTAENQVCEIDISREVAKAKETTPSENQFGSLLVRSFAARQALPVDGAAVTVYRQSLEDSKKNSLMGFTFTDRDGETQPIVLPAPNLDYSQDPNAKAASTYFVAINHPGFISLMDIPVQIFPNTMAVLPVSLQPKPAIF